MNTTRIHAIADEVIALYQQFGNEDYIGEPVSQIEHMCQCAQLAQQNGADADTVLAAFFHDIGHLCEYDKPESGVQHMDIYGIVDHEKLGAAYLLSKGFAEEVCKMVGSHVTAKRYLTFKYPSYYNLLSEASKKTLEHQGGVMSVEEAVAFESDPLCEKYVALRRWDEQAKEVNKPLPDLNEFRTLITNHLLQQHAQA